jgi:hypothetical protein
MQILRELRGEIHAAGSCASLRIFGTLFVGYCGGISVSSVITRMSGFETAIFVIERLKLARWSLSC